MKLSQVKIPSKLKQELKHISKLTPIQEKAINAGLLENKNILACSPTASGKTLVAELAMMNNIYRTVGKAIYIVPLKALASEKYREFKEKYNVNVALSIGDTDSAEHYLSRYDIIVTTSEKLDSLIRHHAPWLRDVKTIVIDEIHLLNDASRGPTLEVIMTLLRMLLKNIQIIGLSATIGNPYELAEWLDAELIKDEWRPVKLKKGVAMDGEVEFYEA